MSTMQTLGRFVRAKRQELRQTNRELATAVGIDPATLSRIENGTMKTLPEPVALQSLAEALSISRLDLLEAAGYLTRDDRQQVNENPYDPGDLRYHVVEAMRSLDMTDPQNEWLMQMFLRELRYEDYPRLPPPGTRQRNAG